MYNTKQKVEHLIFLNEGEKFVPWNKGTLSTKIYTFLHLFNGDVMAKDQFGNLRLFAPDTVIQRIKSELVTYINKNFLIRVTNVNRKGNFLTGAGQYHHLVGHEIANKHFYKAINSTLDKIVFKLRRGLKIEFVSK